MRARESERAREISTAMGAGKRGGGGGRAGERGSEGSRERGGERERERRERERQKPGESEFLSARVSRRGSLSQRPWGRCVRDVGEGVQGLKARNLRAT